jgi:hypothetical protein
LATRHGDSFTYATAGPANFNDYVIISDGSSLGASTNFSEVMLEASSLDPDAFTSDSEQWACFTLAISP